MERGAGREKNNSLVSTQECVFSFAVTVCLVPRAAVSSVAVKERFWFSKGLVRTLSLPRYFEREATQTRKSRLLLSTGTSLR